jgi:hypothetical protein
MAARRLDSGKGFDDPAGDDCDIFEYGASRQTLHLAAKFGRSAHRPYDIYLSLSLLSVASCHIAHRSRFNV